MTAITGIHPYADKFPMLPDSELAELAESIKANGQRNPIVLTTDGLILDGRNRAKACELASVEPETIVYDGDDLAEYVIDCNTSRRHMSTGARAMATALVLVADKKRSGGKWAYGAASLGNGENLRNWQKHMQVAGVILDHASHLAEQVASGDLALDAAYRQAEQARDAERHRLEREERIKAEESDAKAFVEQSAPELAEQVGGGGPFQSYAEAKAVWEKRNREEAERIAREKADKERHEREVRRSLTEMYSEGIGKALMTLGEYGKRDDPESVMEQFSPALLSPPQMERYYTLDNLTSARKFIDALITWKESS